MGAACLPEKYRMNEFRSDQPWRTSPLASFAGASIVTVRDLSVWTSFLLFFFLAAYVSAGFVWPTSVPVHHDDYSNYAAAVVPFKWTAIRPLSTGVIYILSWAGPEWLIGAVRLLTVTYVWLIWKLFALLENPRLAVISAVLYGACVFSTPISAEYARYTGMITHLISGSFGVLAVILLFVAAAGRGVRYVRISALAILLSVLAKEDFLVLYGLSVAVAVAVSPKHAKEVLAYGMSVLVLCLLIVFGAKKLAASSFLGDMAPSSSYYLSLAPESIFKTLFAYFTGAAHPAMQAHGKLVAGIALLAMLTGLALLLRYKRFSWVAYFILAALAVAFPYALLPNHVNAYYEMIWLPFVVLALLSTIRECTVRFLPVCSVQRQTVICISIFALSTFLMLFVDQSARKSIAVWYESIAQENARSFQTLKEKSTQLPIESVFCVSGATAFSPWYMHSGAYLSYVLGVEATWRVEVDDGSPLYSGFLLSAKSSSGRISLALPGDSEATSCVRIDLRA